MAVLNSKVFTIPKTGSSLAENEDACEVEPVLATQLKKDGLRCSISDGATQTSFSGLWARILVDYAKQCDPSGRNLQNILHQAQNDWHTDISSRSLPWYAEEKVKKGAFATLLWLSISYGKDVKDRKWKAVAIGDSNLFVFRTQLEPLVFPLTSSDAFNNSPVLLTSLPARDDRIDSHISIKRGKWQPGDQFILATDALACYLLKKIEAGESPLDELKRVITGEDDDQLAFEVWIRSLRQDMKIKDDDTTLIWVESEI